MRAGRWGSPAERDRAPAVICEILIAHGGLDLDRLRARRLGCVNHTPGGCAQKGAAVVFAGMVNDIAVFRCDSCGWPMWSRGDVVVVDDRDLPKPDQAAFRAGCTRLGIETQEQIRDREPGGHRRGGARDVRVGFDRRGQNWSQNRTAFSEVFGNSKRLKTNVTDRMRRTPDDAQLRYVDVGCGTGGLLAQVIATHPFGHFAGVDISPVMIHSAEARLAPLVTSSATMLDLVVSGAEHIPFRSDWFDLATAELALHHLKSPSAMVTEMARIVRPGGAVVMQVPGPGYTLDVNFGNGWIECPIGPKTLLGHKDPLGRFNSTELQALAVSAGLEPEHLDEDFWRYRFESVESCLKFLGRTGADARIRGYTTPGDLLAPYGHFFSVGPLEIRGAFITFSAIKPGPAGRESRGLRRRTAVAPRAVRHPVRRCHAKDSPTEIEWSEWR